MNVHRNTGIREIASAALHTVITKRYRQTTYGDLYTVELRPTGDTWLLYCTEHPPNPFPDSAQQCHLFKDGRICITPGREPRTVDRALAIVAAFIDGYSAFVRTGTFPNQARTYNV